MSEKMTPISIEKLILNIKEEYKKYNTMFSVKKAYRQEKSKTLPVFCEKSESPLGVAAGPNTQLAQNIVASYIAGARFFELKTVQTMDGEDLAKCISRPCIKADDEGYNCEWSTELTVQQAFKEYVKAWCLLKVLSKAYDLGDSDAFVFNMSVGYDLDGIKSKKIDDFIEGLKDCSSTDVFAECKDALKKHFPELSDDIDNMSPHVCTSVTLSTLHGCPPDEIERIAKEGPTAEELSKIKEYMTKQHAADLKNNGNWLSWIEIWYTHGIDEMTGYQQIVDSLSADDIKAVAARIVKDNNVLKIIMDPK